MARADQSQRGRCLHDPRLLLARASQLAPAERRRQSRLRQRKVDRGQSLHGVDEVVCAGANDCRYLAQDTVDLVALLELQFPPTVAEVDDRQRLDVHGRAGRRCVVNHPGDGGARLGADGEHVPTLAQRHQRLLQRGADAGRAQERLHALLQSVVRRDRLAPNRGELRAGAVGDFTPVVDRTLDERTHGG